MKEALCEAFCGSLTMTEVPIGIAVSTAFLRDDGDAVSFYIVRDERQQGVYRIEDDGSTIPDLEAAGVDFSTAARAEAFGALIANHHAYFDEEEMLLHTAPMREGDLPAAAMRFVAMMLRMGDFLLLTRDKIASTFKEDATGLIRQKLGPSAVVKEGVAAPGGLTDNVPDLLIEAPGRRPVAIFFGTSPQKVYEAILLQMQAQYEAEQDLAVVALLENDAVINRDLRRRANNRLTALPTYSGDESAAIERIRYEAVGPGARVADRTIAH